MKKYQRYYYVVYSRNMAFGGRIQIRAVMKESQLAWYFLNFSKRYDYIIESARLATEEEIKQFSRELETD